MILQPSLLPRGGVGEGAPGSAQGRTRARARAHRVTTASSVRQPVVINMHANARRNHFLDVEQRIRKLETLVEYINRYNINNAVNANHLQVLLLNRDEAVHRNRINYEIRNHVNDDNDNDDDELAEDEIDGGAPAF